MVDDIAALFERLSSGDRAALAQGITLVESEKDSDRAAANTLLRNCIPLAEKTLFAGITGIPGAGKSTLMNALGMSFIADGHRLAVLAIDPSSKRSKGSIMGDKTRMEDLTRSENAFIRPSPTSGNLGGVSRRTREASFLCAAAGYDMVFIETVGVGQNELAIDELVDISLLLLVSGTGDQLQGIKRGIMEAADIVAINKVEGENLKKGEQTAMELRNAISLLTPRDSGLRPKVFTCSAISERGIPELKTHLNELAAALKQAGTLSTRKQNRKKSWLEQRIKDDLLRTLELKHNQLELNRLRNAVMDGALDPISASEEFLSFMKKAAETPS